MKAFIKLHHETDPRWLAISGNTLSLLKTLPKELDNEAIFRGTYGRMLEVEPPEDAVEGEYRIADGGDRWELVEDGGGR